jgi:hypothetical protein
MPNKTQCRRDTCVSRYSARSKDRTLPQAKRYPRRYMLLIVVALLLAACQPQDATIALPTDASIVITETASAIESQTPTFTPTATPLTLPPTFTPTFTPSATPTPVLTATPQGFSERGTIFYLYNQDAIASVRGDGTNNEIALTFGVGQTISDLQPSPDERLLAFVGPQGSARDVFITSRDGTYLQRISCLGFSDVRRPQWSLDGTFLTFYAAPDANAPGAIYRANVEGANDCPTGNEQRILVNLETSIYGGSAWSQDGRRYIYAADNGLMVLDTLRGIRQQLTQPSLLGRDYQPRVNVGAGRLAFLQSQRDGQTGRINGSLVIFDDDMMRDLLEGEWPENPPFRRGIDEPLLLDFRWSADGEEVLLMTPDAIATRELARGIFEEHVTGLSSPIADYGPQTRYIVYRTADANGVAQLFEYDRRRERSTQLTENPEGTITDVHWLGG